MSSFNVHIVLQGSALSLLGPLVLQGDTVDLLAPSHEEKDKELVLLSSSSLEEVEETLLGLLKGIHSQDMLLRLERISLESFGDRKSRLVVGSCYEGLNEKILERLTESFSIIHSDADILRNNLGAQVSPYGPKKGVTSHLRKSQRRYSS